MPALVPSALRPRAPWDAHSDPLATVDGDVRSRLVGAVPERRSPSRRACALRHRACALWGAFLVVGAVLLGACGGGDAADGATPTATVTGADEGADVGAEAPVEGGEPGPDVAVDGSGTSDGGAPGEDTGGQSDDGDGPGGEVDAGAEAGDGAGVDDSQPGGAAALCAAEPPTPLGDLVDPALDEVSGIALTGPVDGGIWAIEDSGNPADLVLIAPTGETLATVALPVANVDWEDLAAVPGGDLVVADVGDNLRARPAVVLHRVTPPAGGAGDAVIVSSIEVTYPDGGHDVEALFVDPATGDAYLVTKALDQATFEFFVDTIVFRVPGVGPADGGGAAGEGAGSVGQEAEPGVGPVVAEEVARLQLGTARLVTAADIAADGSTIVWRTYDTVLVWDRPAGSSIADALAAEPCEAPAAFEGFGEAIALTPDATGFVTLAEGDAPTIWRTAG